MKLHSAMTGLMFSAAALLTPAILQAQFTTFVAPPRKAVVDSTKPAIVAAVKARSDSIARMSISDMKAWVDSAAGTSTQVASASDTTMSNANAAATIGASTSTARTPTSRANPQSTTTTFSNGAIAPNTASTLPAYLAAGFSSLAAGLVLMLSLRRPPAEASK